MSKPSHPCQGASSQSGFTLIELLVAVTVLALLLGVGIPGFSSMIQRHRLTAEVNELVTALNLARSEASKRGLRVSVCALDSDGTNCDDTPSWSRGWMVFTDAGTAGELDSDDKLLQIWPASAGNFTFDSSTGSAYVSFLSTRADDDAALDIYQPGCSGDKKRHIEIKNTGRISLSRIAC